MSDEPRDVHVYPSAFEDVPRIVAPGPEHKTDGSPCWCEPEALDVEGTDAKVIVHRYRDEAH